jgi:Fe-S cluster biogenesis protein NfuA
MNTHINRHIHLYTESSPNPDSIKIVLNLVLSPEGKDFNFLRGDSGVAQSPLADALFSGFGWISQVFIMNNFITVTRDSDADWYELLSEIKPFIKAWFEEKKPVFVFADETAMQSAVSGREPGTETEKQIIEVLEEYVRPAVESDGGAIAFHSFQDGVVQVELRGSCSGCPSSALTLKQGIENLLTRMVPEVREVVALNR